jgi:two-component system chemotaxis sensor kinase CheA
MDELLGEFLTETGESLDLVDAELVRFEQDPNNVEMLNSIFRLVHTVKGTCGFLGLHRLAKLAHAAETLMGQYRDGAPVTVDSVSVILASLDRIKQILAGLEATGSEPEGADDDLIVRLEGLALAQASTHGSFAEPDSIQVSAIGDDLQRPLRPGEVSLEELERAWRAAPGPDMATVAGQARAGDSATDAKDAQARNQTVRVSVDTLEHLMTTVSELVLTRNQLLDLMRKTGDGAFKTPLQRLSTVTAELQEGIMKARMQPIANAWQKLPRLVRELSLELGKKIELELNGGDTELDRQVLELIKDPLIHMVRNAADHGLESSTVRARAGKPPTGRIKLSAGQEGGFIVIEVADDGRGMSAEKIRAKVLESGLAKPTELNRLSDQDVFKFIFRAGFSMAGAVTEISGRGVGMDVVRANIELIGGMVELKSTSAKGTTFRIKIPLTLAIMAALIVATGGQRFAVPQFSVVELVRVGKTSEHRLERINETVVLRLRNRLLPLLDLSELLKLEEAGSPIERAERNTLTVVVMQIGARLFGVLVDSVFHTEELVVKPMSTKLRDIGMFSGNTILGDGSVIMIIDPNALGSAIGSVELPDEVRDVRAEEIEISSEKATALLLFRAGTPVLKAVPLSLITRLEEIDVTLIEYCNGGDLVQYRGALMPLVSVDGESRRRDAGVQPVLVFTEGGRPVGLAVDEIVDIVEAPLTIEIATNEPGVIGGAIVKGNATEIVDVSHYLAHGLGKRLKNMRNLGERDIRVLLIDDSQFFRNMLAPLLAASGYRVTVAGSADEALALKDKGLSFDLIISDLEMPGMDGIALAELIKGDAKWGKVPLIALSSYGSPQLIERTRAAGFVSHVGKFDRQGLMDTLEECCKQWGFAA